MPILLLLVVALTVGAAVTVAVWRFPTAPFVPTRPTQTATEAVGHTLAQHSSLRRLLVGRLDPEVATGLALTLALAVLILGGLVLAVLAYLVRSSDALVGARRERRRVGVRPRERPLGRRAEGRHDARGDVVRRSRPRSPSSSQSAFASSRARWVAAYLAFVIVGQNVLTRTIKELADRVRPDLNPIAETLGPSFPSGHSATAAAFYAAAALVLGRGRPRLTRALLAGGAVAITVAVAGSRVLLDVHWLSDVIAGVALGWAWFAVCSVAFGGRILRFGAAAERAAEQAAAETGAPRGTSFG